MDPMDLNSKKKSALAPLFETQDVRTKKGVEELEARDLDPPRGASLTWWVFF